MSYQIIKKYYPKLASIYIDNEEEWYSALNVIIDTGYAPYVEKLSGLKIEKNSTYNYSNILAVIKASSISIKLTNNAAIINQYETCKIPLEKLAIFLSWLIVESYRKHNK